MIELNHKDFEKVAFGGAGWGYLKDVAAGIDPTGTSTFRLASGYNKDQAKHRFAGDVGGLIGGAAIGAALPAAMTGGAALLLRKKYPLLAKEFVGVAKGSFDVIRPGRMMKHIKSVPHVVKYKAQAFKTLKGSSQLSDKMDELTALAAKMKGKQVPPVDVQRYKSLRDDVVRLRADLAKMKSMEGAISQKYYGGGSVSGGVGRTMTALTTIPTAGATGLINLSSAHMQFNEAQKQRKRRIAATPIQ